LKATSLAFEAFGVPLTVVCPQALTEAVLAVLPPGSRALPASTGTVATIRLTGLVVHGADGSGSMCATEVDALHALDREVRAVVSLAAPGQVFVHAGVVAVDGSAIVIPGRSFTGKTTLVGALLELGATYLSDEYAVLDPSGAVWPYRRPLSFRTRSGRTDVAPEALGPVGGPGPFTVAAVISTSYRAGATWDPVPGTAAECAFALLDNAVAARTRPGAVLAAVSAVARDAQHLIGARGDAVATAVALLADAASGDPPPTRSGRAIRPSPAPRREPTRESYP